jgi:hypothetical protein
MTVIPAWAGVPHSMPALEILAPDPIWKTNWKSKRAGGMAQGVECLPSEPTWGPEFNEGTAKKKKVQNVVGWMTPLKEHQIHACYRRNPMEWLTR